MIKIKVNGKSKEIPQNWEEVSFDLFLKLLEADKDQVKILSAILDLSESEVKGAQIEGFESLMHHLRFLQKPFELDPVPKKIGYYQLPADIQYESIEQYQETLSEINRVTTLDLPEREKLIEQTKSIPLYAAIYVTKPYDSDSAKLRAKSFHSLPCVEVMAAGSFFQAKSLSIHSGLPMSYLRRHTLLKKRWPGLKKYLRHLVFTKLWIVSRVMWAKMTRWF